MADEVSNGSWSLEIDRILSVGERLTELGSWNWALSKAAVLEAVGLIRDLGVGVLGGDVYRREGAELVFDYGGWHSDPGPDETKDAFIRRSHDEAVAYIRAYANPDAVFAIVPDVGRANVTAVS